jgi:hypothetical protein
MVRSLPKLSGATALCLVTLACSLAWTSVAHAVEHLCTAEEKVLFACETGKRLASVCAAANFSAKSGYIQFRYGTPKEIEIEWPKERSNRRYVTKGNLFYLGKFGVYLRFKRDRESFVVFGVPGRSNGLVIEKNNIVREKRICKESAMADFNDIPLPIADVIAVSGVSEP